MFDVKAIRDNPQAFDKGLERRGIFGDGDGKFSSSRVLALDDSRKKLVTELQEWQARRNTASKEIGKAKGAKDEALAAKLMAEVAGLKEKIAAGEAQEKEIDRAIEDYLSVIPNAPRDDVPFGSDETGNKEVRRHGTPPKLAFKPKQHFELGEALGMMDFETAQKVSGARFVFLKGGLARLERALGQFMLDIHTEEFGYTEVVPPMLVRDAAAYGTANLPKFAEDLFRIHGEADEATTLVKIWGATSEQRTTTTERLESLKPLVEAMSNTPQYHALKDRLDEIIHATVVGAGEAKHETNGVNFAAQRLWLIPTAEVSLTNLAREKIHDEAELPIRVTAHTPCFRSEAGSAGRDVRGMIRQHQFSKVELVSITTPETSLNEHERMTKAAETVLQRLGLAYRTMLLCTGDMGFASQKTYDIEVWLPGQDTYREISSCSVCGDFQARRMGARYRPKGSKDVRYVHTLNGSGLAVGRTLIAVMENYQQEDGSIKIPDALVPYMGGKTVIGR